MIVKQSLIFSSIAALTVLSLPVKANADTKIKSYEDYRLYCSPQAFRYQVQSSDCSLYQNIYENRLQQELKQQPVRRRTQKKANAKFKTKVYVGGSIGAFFPTEDVELIEFDEDEVIENFFESEFGLSIEELEAETGLSFEEIRELVEAEIGLSTNEIIESQLGLSSLGLSSEQLREIASLDLDTGFGGSLFVGGRFDRNFATDLEFMIFGGGTELDEVNFSQWGIFLNPKFIQPLSSKDRSVSLFISPGIGISKGKVNYELTDADAEALGTEEGLSVSLEDDISFAWQIKLGLSIPFDEKYSSFTQVRYINPTGENTIDSLSTEIGFAVEF